MFNNLFAVTYVQLLHIIYFFMGRVYQCYVEGAITVDVVVVPLSVNPVVRDLVLVLVGFAVGIITRPVIVDKAAPYWHYFSQGISGYVICMGSLPKLASNSLGLDLLDRSAAERIPSSESAFENGGNSSWPEHLNSMDSIPSMVNDMSNNTSRCPSPTTPRSGDILLDTAQAQSLTGSPAVAGLRSPILNATCHKTVEETYIPLHDISALTSLDSSVLSIHTSEGGEMSSPSQDVTPNAERALVLYSRGGAVVDARPSDGALFKVLDFLAVLVLWALDFISWVLDITMRMVVAAHLLYEHVAGSDKGFSPFFFCVFAAVFRWFFVVQWRKLPFVPGFNGPMFEVNIAFRSAGAQGSEPRASHSAGADFDGGEQSHEGEQVDEVYTPDCSPDHANTAMALVLYHPQRYTGEADRSRSNAMGADTEEVLRPLGIEVYGALEDLAFTQVLEIEGGNEWAALAVDEDVDDVFSLEPSCEAQTLISNTINEVFEDIASQLNLMQEESMGEYENWTRAMSALFKDSALPRPSARREFLWAPVLEDLVEEAEDEDGPALGEEIMSGRVLSKFVEDFTASITDVTIFDSEDESTGCEASQAPGTSTSTRPSRGVKATTAKTPGVSKIPVFAALGRFRNRPSAQGEKAARGEASPALEKGKGVSRRQSWTSELPYTAKQKARALLHAAKSRVRTKAGQA